MKVSLARPLDPRSEQRRADSAATPVTRHAAIPSSPNPCRLAWMCSNPTIAPPATATSVPSSIQLAARACTSTGGFCRDAVALLRDRSEQRRQGHAVALEPWTDHERRVTTTILACSGTIGRRGSRRRHPGRRKPPTTPRSTRSCAWRSGRHPDEVALLVERIRSSENFVPDLTLVAADDSGVIGHVMSELGRGSRTVRRAGSPQPLPYRRCGPTASAAALARS